MGLRDKFRKKHDSDDEPSAGSAPPEFTFIRTDTHSAEVIYPPSADPSRAPGQLLSADPRSDSKQRLSLDVFRSGSHSRSPSVSSNKSSATKRLSQRLHLSRAPSSSENVPEHLPAIVGGDEDKDGAESQWEKRATMLARENEKHRSRPGSPTHGEAPPVIPKLRLGDDSGRSTPTPTTPQEKTVSSQAIDEDIQQAIRLHEAGELEKSTALFGRLADPKGANNPLSQVLYGLALRYVCLPHGCVERHAVPSHWRPCVLRRDASSGRCVGHATVGLPNNRDRHKLTRGARHGWGCQPDTAKAVTYLSAAASNAADVEHLALQAGLKKGGAAKGELVLAIFELANCFRQGWGIPKDPIAAKQVGSPIGDRVGGHAR